MEPIQHRAGRRVVVTGAGGFVGRAVVQTLLATGHRAIGVCRTAPDVPLPGGVEAVCADLATDPLHPVLAELRPDTIIHCAGLTHAPETGEGRAALTAANLTATVRLIEAAARLPQPVRLVVVSSAAIYAPMPEGLAATTEDHPLRPAGAYGVSKAAATLHALAQADRLDLDLAVAVPFNVTGPGQPAHLVPQVFVARLRADPLAFALSNPQSVRDWVDVRDVAAALVMLGQPQGPRGVFNVATGLGHSLQEVLDVLCRIGGWQPVVREGAAHNVAGVTRSIGSPARLVAATGWTPRVSLEDSLRDMIRAAS